MVWKLHSVIVHKPVSLTEARKHAKHIINGAKGYILREDPASWRFSFNKNVFIKTSFRSKVVNKDITLVYGKLKPKV
jgi:hypothetical protein